MLQLFRKKQQFLAVSYATILHCLVDFCCIYLMMQLVFPACRLTSLSNWLLYTMLYNFIAFAGQLPVGIFGDWLQRNMNLIAVGLLFLLLDCSNDCGFEYGVIDPTDFLPKFRRTKLTKTGIFHETDAGQLVASHGILLYLCCCTSFFCRKCDAFSMGKELACTVPDACNCVGKGWRWNSC